MCFIAYPESLDIAYRMFYLCGVSSVTNTECGITFLLSTFVLQFIDTLLNLETEINESLRSLTLLPYSVGCV